MRYTPWDRPLLNLQVGKFATMDRQLGSPARLLDQPFITAPLPYEHVTTVSDASAPGRRRVSRPPQSARQERLWVPVIWGTELHERRGGIRPALAFDYALEVKNAALAARPE
jgi:hypothetical protein